MMNAGMKAWFNHYMGRERHWNRYDFLVFGDFPVFSLRQEVAGKRWIFSICKLPVLFRNPW